VGLCWLTFIEFSEELFEPTLSGLVSFDFAVPAALGSISDECSFCLEASAEAGYVVAGGGELGASQDEVAFARGLRQVPGGSVRVRVRS
jgi:hypothetical protein